MLNEEKLKEAESRVKQFIRDGMIQSKRNELFIKHKPYFSY